MNYSDREIRFYLENKTLRLGPSITSLDTLKERFKQRKGGRKYSDKIAKRRKVVTIN